MIKAPLSVLVGALCSVLAFSGARKCQGSEATSVNVQSAELRTFESYISGPGKTAPMEIQKVTAPFAGTILTFGIAEGDRLRPHQIIATILSSNSVAALQGARQMLNSARNARERRDARRALQLAERSSVARTLRATEDSLVVSISGDEGIQVAQDQVLATLAPRNAISFLAQIDQTHVAQVRPGLPATISLAGSKRGRKGRVHAVLPAGAPEDLRSPVRIDFLGSFPPTLGIFGTAKIKIGEHRDALAVPIGAVIRNDVFGTVKVAVDVGSKLHWIPVKTGMTQDGWVEILSGKLRAGENVIVDGQIGLAEGSPVRSVEMAGAVPSGTFSGTKR